MRTGVISFQQRNSLKTSTPKTANAQGLNYSAGPTHDHFVRFSSAGPTDAEKEMSKAREKLDLLLIDSKAPESEKKKAHEDFKKASKRASDAKRAKDTLKTAIAAIGGAVAGATAASLTAGEPVTTAKATKIGAGVSSAYAADHLATKAANVYRDWKDDIEKYHEDRAKMTKEEREKKDDEDRWDYVSF